MAEAKVERPLGITILAVLDILGGIVAILAGIAFAALFGVAAGFAAAAGAELEIPLGGMLGILAGIVMVLVLIFIVVGILGLLVGWGFWKGSGWAWILGVVFYGIDLVLSLLTAVTPPYTGIIGVIIAALLIYYMFRPNVKAWFGKA